jgi:hypothetical protein
LFHKTIGLFPWIARLKGEPMNFHVKRVITQCGELVTPLLTVIPVGVYFTPY